ncbi:tape measure protein [Flavonifractor sp. An112]|uniref:tape measure protein n=1 Tax=Flavonifractor sp. An112 TaxID=1965544 RepID=UPI00174B3352|nr:tape measure protein [Flavonifractor sp. An112]HIZ92953.1 tape measure protein [Candidatus Flavonifractor avicola]
MPTDASIAMSVKDNLSSAIVGMKNSMTNFRSDVTALQGELDRLNATRVQMRVDLTGAKREAQQAQKAFEELGDSATEAERQAAEADWKKAEENLENIRQQYDLVGRQVRQTTRDMEAATGAISKADNRAGSAGGGKGILSALGQAGAWSMLGDVASQWAGTLVGSTFGSDVGSLFSSALGGAGSGAAIGSMIAPGVGTAIGAALGGLVGLVGGGAQIYEQQDDAFKEYYQQLYEQGQQQEQESLTSGSATASQRELDEIAFNRLLGQGTGSKYLSDLRVMAAATPMEYSDLTNMSRALATGFGDSPERMLDLMEAIGDAGSAVGVTAEDMTMMAQAMSRMQGSGKASLEYLNILQERGVNVIGMLAEAYGKSQGEIYDMISKGEIMGQDAVDTIQSGMESMYGGAMETMAQTFEGLTSTLSDAMTEIDAARGQGYNETRASGLQQEIDAYGGLLGEAVSNLNTIAGQNQAYLDNLSDQYTREALSAVLLGQETTPGLFDDKTVAELREMRGDFIKASADYENGSQEAGLKMDNLRMEAEALATTAYESSEAYQLVHDSELDLIGAIRENTAALNGWRNNYDTQQEFSKGQGTSTQDDLPGGTWGWWRKNAYGLDRVPYDDFPALLHEGERVLTAREAREADSKPGRSISITITGNQFGAGVSAEEIAQRLADQIELKFAAGVLS